MSTTEKNNEGPQIFRLITEVKKKAGALAATQTSGIPFPFRGIDGTVNHLAQHVEEAGIVIVPSVREHEVTERSPDGKRVVKTSKVITDFTFYAPDGSSVTATTTGLADDFADRSAAQAQSVAFRVALLQTFFLPTQSPEPEQTGQAVQDHAEKPQTPAQRQIDKARAATPAAKGNSELEDLKKKVRDAIESGTVTREEVVSKQTEIKEATKKTGLDLQKELVKALGV